MDFSKNDEPIDELGPARAIVDGYQFKNVWAYFLYCTAKQMYAECCSLEFSMACNRLNVTIEEGIDLRYKWLQAIKPSLMWNMYIADHSPEAWDDHEFTTMLSNNIKREDR